MGAENNIHLRKNIKIVFSERKFNAERFKLFADFLSYIFLIPFVAGINLYAVLS